MPLPGNVPHFDVYLVDFDALEPMYVLPPPGTTLGVWQKLVELERKLHAFDWATMSVRNPAQCTTLINDLAFAFVLGFEATIQVLNDERPRPNLDAWLTSLPDYTLLCRGIRTMRNLEAHIRTGQMQAGTGSGVYTRFMTSMTPQPPVAWRFPQISTAEYNSLKPHGRKLNVTELADWNQQVETQFAVNLMRESLMSLVEIVKRA